MNEWSSHSQSALMAHIIEVRYTDIEEEKQLSEELLEWALVKSDSYAQAFALTHIGDYWVAQGQRDKAEHNLSLAYEIVVKDEDSYPALAMRVNSLLGICREMTGDEQGCVRHYLKAIKFAEQLGDVASKCVVLNNLAFVFQNHQNSDQALSYYLEAHALLDGNAEGTILPYLLSNITELLVEREDFDEAAGYINELEALPIDPELVALLSARCWCFYYAVQGDAARSKEKAQIILEEERAHGEEPLWAFDSYSTFFLSMMKISEKEYAAEFLNLMKQPCSQGRLGQVWRLEEMSMEYVLKFEPQELHLESFRSFFQKFEDHQISINGVVAQAMRTKIELESNLHQRDVLREQRDSLEYEASIDELTQIGNRRHLNQLLAAREQGYVGGSLGIIMLDIDYFKEYNDFYGHLGGDEMLRLVGKIASKHGNENFHPCRFGGDEAACLCDGVNAEQIEAYIQAVRTDLASRAVPHEESPYGVLTLSIGYALADESLQVEPLVVLQQADRALYESKQKGRNTYTREQVG